MATRLIWPSGLRTNSINFQLEQAGRTQVASDNDARVTVIDRGASYWEGTVGIAPISRDANGVRLTQVVQKLFTQLTNDDTFVDMPVPLVGFADIPPVNENDDESPIRIAELGTVQASEPDVWGIKLNMPTQDARTVLPRLQLPINGIVKINGRLLEVDRVIEDTTRTRYPTIVLHPYDRLLDLAVGDVITDAKTIRVRCITPASVIRNIHWTEGTTLQFREYIGPLESQRIRPNVVIEPPEVVRVTRGVPAGRKVRYRNTATTTSGNAIAYLPRVDTDHGRVTVNASDEATFVGLRAGSSTYTTVYQDSVTGAETERVKQFIVDPAPGGVPPEIVGNPGIISGIKGESPRFKITDMVESALELTFEPSAVNEAIAKPRLDGDYIYTDMFRAGQTRGNVLITDLDGATTNLPYDILAAEIVGQAVQQTVTIDLTKPLPSPFNVPTLRTGPGAPPPTANTIVPSSFIQASDGSTLSFSIREKLTSQQDVRKTRLESGTLDSETGILELAGNRLQVFATSSATAGQTATLEIVATHENGSTRSFELVVTFIAASVLIPVLEGTPPPIILEAVAGDTAKFRPSRWIKSPNGLSITFTLGKETAGAGYTISSTADANGDYTITRTAPTSQRGTDRISVVSTVVGAPSSPTFYFNIEWKRTGETDTDKPTISSLGGARRFTEGAARVFIRIGSNFDPRTGVDVSVEPETPNVVDASIAHSGNDIRLWLSNFRAGTTRLKFLSTKQGTDLVSEPAYMTIIVDSTNTGCYWVGPSSRDMTFNSGQTKTLPKNRDSYCLDAEGDARSYKTPISSNPSALTVSYLSNGDIQGVAGTVSQRTEVNVTFEGASITGNTDAATEVVTAIINGSAPAPQAPETSTGPTLGLSPNFIYPDQEFTIYFNNYITGSRGGTVNFNASIFRITSGSRYARIVSGGSGHSSVTLRAYGSNIIRSAQTVRFAFSAPDEETGAPSPDVTGTARISPAIADITPRFSPFLRTSDTVRYGETKDVPLTI